MVIFDPPGRVKIPQKGGNLPVWRVVQTPGSAGRRPTEKPKMTVLTLGQPAVALYSAGAWSMHSLDQAPSTVDNARKAACMGMYGVPYRVLYG